MQVFEFENGAHIAGLWLRPGRKVVQDEDGTLIAIQQGTPTHLTFVYKDAKTEFSFEAVEQDDGRRLPYWKVELPNRSNYFFGHGPIDSAVLERAKEKIRSILPAGPWQSREWNPRVAFY